MNGGLRLTLVLLLDGQNIKSDLREVDQKLLWLLKTKAPLDNTGSHALAEVVVASQTIAQLEARQAV